jgi:predicted adenine nucleotide alpha hydrolase (AANH) superfamily ATPase
MSEHYIVEFIFWLPNENGKPTKEFDERTRRTKKFASEKEANAFIKELSSYEDNKGWLAQVELQKVSVKTIKQFR